MNFFNGFKNCSVEQGKLFEAMIVLTKAKTIVEIGVAYGTTTKYLCDGASKTNGKVFGFDVWDWHGTQNQYQPLSSKKNTEEYLISENLTNFELIEINTKTKEFSDRIKNIGIIDFAFIDGDHSYNGIKNDFDNIYPQLSNTGIIAFHDTLRIDGCREFMIDLRTKFDDGTFDVFDFPFGNNQKRAGISFLMKRSFHNVNIEIDEICGSISTPYEIYNKEKNYIIEKTKK